MGSSLSLPNLLVLETFLDRERCRPTPINVDRHCCLGQTPDFFLQLSSLGFAPNTPLSPNASQSCKHLQRLKNDSRNNQKTLKTIRISWLKTVKTMIYHTVFGVSEL